MRVAVCRVLAAAAVFIASSSSGFQRETTDDPTCVEAPGVNCSHQGRPLFWRDMPVIFDVNADFSGVSFNTAFGAIDRSFQSWESASGRGIEFESGGGTDRRADGQDGRNTVLWRSFPDNRESFAQSILTFRTDDGELLDVDIELNASFDWAVLSAGQNDPTDPRVDIQAVVTHEAGHLLGLDHENRFGSDVVMFFRDSVGNTTHRTLTSDDRAGVRTIYPLGSDGGSDGDGGGGGGGGGCSAGTGAGSADAAITLGLAALLALRRKPARSE